MKQVAGEVCREFSIISPRPLADLSRLALLKDSDFGQRFGQRNARAEVLKLRVGSKANPQVTCSTWQLGPLAVRVYLPMLSDFGFKAFNKQQTDSANAFTSSSPPDSDDLIIALVGYTCAVFHTDEYKRVCLNNTTLTSKMSDKMI